MRRRAQFALAVALSLVAASALAEDTPPAPSCAAPEEMTAIQPPLAHAAGQIEQGRRLTIVAVGSSSTQGVGASAPAQSYPSRLEAELRERVPGAEIRVINRGKGGQDVGEELERLAADVIAEHPDLVIWQVGTNAVLRRDDLVLDDNLLQRGIDLLKQSGADIVLMDLQYAPRVLERPSYPEMERLIANAAKQEQIGLFRRFDFMRWHASQPGALAMVGADGLHMNDRGYGCLASQLADALAANWRGQQLVAGSPQPASVAGLAKANRTPPPSAAPGR
jgi:acyl-CoA thioesterase-1